MIKVDGLEVNKKEEYFFYYRQIYINSSKVRLIFYTDRITKDARKRKIN